MIIVTEETCRDIIGRLEAYTAVESVFAVMAAGDARNFPVVRESLGHADALYGFKSGFDNAGEVLGLKSGGYWPGNEARGLTNHQSTVFLFDPDTGRPSAMVGGNYLTAIRTAAASAVSIQHLSRKDSKVLGIIGAGHQSTFQLQAALEQRDFEKVIGWNRTRPALSRLEQAAAAAGLPFEAVDTDQLGAQADVIITITSSYDPILMASHVKPGTHIACMGTDTVGKQEVDARLVAASTCFTDELSQSVSIGECQHAVKEGWTGAEAITAIGEVIRGAQLGRSSETEITLFDGTGVGLQDLAVASAVVQQAQQKGMATQIEF